MDRVSKIRPSLDILNGHKGSPLLHLVSFRAIGIIERSENQKILKDKENKRLKEEMYILIKNYHLEINVKRQTHISHG
ncbi:hypothetical protein [Peribacillus frigoritolerans]|uniref:hypothetical protein n=1 Tax=Peribacillus frigoritolerans TaxID=450367 RepID=UPI0039A3BD7F